MILITGATGKLGHHVVAELLAKVPASQIAVAVRSPDKAADFAKLGIAVRQADYSRPETLDAALAGVDKVLLISSNEVGQRVAQHGAVIAAAKRAKVKLLAYTSILRADTSTLELAREHLATEIVLRASGVPFVLLRNGWYLENYTENLAPALAHGSIAGAAQDGRIAAAARADYAAAAVAVLTSEGHANQVYELAGDRPFTMTELAAEVANQSGKPIAYANLRPAAYRDLLVSSGLPTAVAGILANADEGVTRGELDDTTGTLRRLIGRATTPLADAVARALRA